MRGMITDVQRTVGMIEVKATKAADLVESVQPDKLMIQVQKEDGKIEGLRGMLEAKEEMLKNIMDQLKKMRDQMKVFQGVEQVIKLNQEVKDEIMIAKRVVAEVERHADRVENVFIESQKSFEAFNTFADRLEDMKSEQKDLGAKADKLEVSVGAAIKKKEFEDKIEKIEKSDKKVKKFLEENEKYFTLMDEKFTRLESKLRSEFEFKIEKAEILSRAVDELLTENPLFADGLKLQEYLHKHLGVDTKAIKDVMHEKSEAAATIPSQKGEEASTPKGDSSKPDEKMVEGMTAVKK
jgi:hypothetical protein